MGNTQQSGEEQSVQDSGSRGGSAAAAAAAASARRRQSSATLDAEDVVDLDGDFIKTGKAKNRRPTAASLLGIRGDEVAAESRRRANSRQGHSRNRGSVIPQQVVKFERTIVQEGNIFEHLEEELSALLERESPSVPSYIKSSSGIPLPKPIGRGQLARQHVVYGSSYFPVHVPKYHDTCPEEESHNLQVLKISKAGLTLYTGYHYSSFEWSSALTVLKKEKLEKKLGKVIEHFPIRYLSQWRVMENHFSWRFQKPAPPGGQPTQSGYTVESCEVKSIGKTLEAYLAAVMRSLNMNTDGVFNPKLEGYGSAEVRGQGAEHLRRGTTVDLGESIRSPSSGRHKRGSSFMVDSPLRKGTSPGGPSSGAVSSLSKGKSGRARKRASLAALMGGTGEHDKLLDHGIVVISGIMKRRAGGLLGYGKTMTDKFYVLYRTSQGHYLAEFRQGRGAACLPDNPRENWRWPKNFIDLSTTLRMYSPSVADSDAAGELSLDLVTPSRIWTFKFDHEKVLGKWIRRLSEAIRSDALIVPDEHFEYACEVFRRLDTRDAYGDRLLKKIGDAQVILSGLGLDIEFLSEKVNNLAFNYWELMSWRGLRRKGSGALHLAMRFVKNKEIVEIEIACYQLEAIDLLEAHIMLFTSKLSAGVSKLQQGSSKAPKMKKPTRGSPGSSGKSKPPPPSGAPAPSGQPPKSHSRASGSRNAKQTAPNAGGSTAQAIHAASSVGSAKLKKKLKKRGKASQ